MRIRSLFLRILALAALAAPAAAPAQAPAPRVVGVYDWDSGDPIAGADVGLVDAGVAWRTSSSGVVAMVNVPGGRHLLQVRRVGYRPHMELITISPRDTVPLTIMLHSAAVELETVKVTAAAEVSPRLEVTGFYHRRETTAVPRSAFWTRAELDSIHATDWKDVVPRVLGARVDGWGNPRLRCGTPSVILDGIPLVNTSLNDIAFTAVGGVEFYSSPAQVPVEFNQTAQARSQGGGGGSAMAAGFQRMAARPPVSPGCVVVIWTK